MKRNYNDKEYAQFRKEVLKRDKKTCMMPECNNKTKLQVHHIQPWSEASSLRYEPSNGITLCKKCHQYITGKEWCYVNLFKGLVNDKQKGS